METDDPHDGTDTILNLEEALQDDQERAEALLKSAARFTSALKAWRKASQTGHMANRQKAVDLARELAPTLIPATEGAAEAWTFDVRAYLESDAWQQELQEAAELQGLRTLVEGDTVISSPLIVRAQPGRGSLQLGKTNHPAIRPRMVAAELKRLREKTASANSQQFLDSLYQTCRRFHREGVYFIKFREVYDVFCLTPGWKKENPPAAFAQQIYALHRSGIRTTRDGRLIEIEYPSGHPRERDIFTVIAEDGRTVRYYGIRFR